MTRKPYSVAIVTWSQHDLLNQAIASMPPGEDYFIVNSREFKCISAAYNHAILEGLKDHQAVVVMSDDVQWVGDTGGDLYDLLTTVGKKTNTLIATTYDINVVGNRGLSWNLVPPTPGLAGMFCWCVTAELPGTVGYFDEGYQRSWWEDIDMLRRIELSGHTIAVSAPVKHVGAASERFDSEVAEAKRKYWSINMQRYVAKWGGMPGKEIYRTPFNE